MTALKPPRVLFSMTTGQSKKHHSITESRWEPLDLSQEDIEALLRVRDEWASEKDPRFFTKAANEFGEVETTKILDVRRARGGGVEIRVFDAIGAIDLPDSVLIVYPKIPIAHFNYIATHALVPPAKQKKSNFGLSGADHFLELVCTWAVESVEAILRDGLIRGYSPIHDEVLAIKGRINVRDATRKLYTGKLNLECQFDEFSANTALNRVLKQCLTFVASNPALTKSLSSRAKRALKHFDGVGNMVYSDLRAKTNRNSKHYADAIEFASNVLEQSGRDLATGKRRSRSFLYKTPLLIEEGIRKIVESGLAPVAVVKPRETFLATSNGQRVGVNPDLSIGKSPVYTGDVKYKIQANYWRRSDLAQAVFFAVAYDSPKALVIDFADEASKANGTVAVSNIEVTPVSWNVSAGIDPVAAREQLLSQISHWLTTSRLVFAPALLAS